MNTPIDWNCRLLMPLSCDSTVRGSHAQAICEMRERFGFSRFCLTADFCHKSESVAAFRIRLSRAKEEMRRLLPDTIRMTTASSVLLLPELSELIELNKLLFKEYLILSLPLSSYADWMDFEINRLLYRRHLRLLFSSFERALILYPKEAIERLLRIKGAVFQFSYSALSDSRVIQSIKTILGNGNVILFGSGMNAPEKLAFYDTEDNLRTLFRHLSSSERAILTSFSQSLWTSTISRP